MRYGTTLYSKLTHGKKNSVKPLVCLFFLLLCGSLIYLSRVDIKEGYAQGTGNQGTGKGNPFDPNERDDSDKVKVTSKGKDDNIVAMVTDTSPDQKEMLNSLKTTYSMTESLTRSLISIPYNISKTMSRIPFSIGKSIAEMIKTTIRILKDFVRKIINLINSILRAITTFFYRIGKKISSLLD